MTERPWDASRARAAIAAVVADAESAFDDDVLWLPHPLDLRMSCRRRSWPRSTTAPSGVIWALHELARAGAADLRRDWAPVAVRLAERYPSQPDYQDFVDGPVPSLWMGESGILLVAHGLAPAAWQEERLLEAVRANADEPDVGADVGIPGDDDRGAGDARADGEAGVAGCVERFC